LQQIDNPNPSFPPLRSVKPHDPAGNTDCTALLAVRLHALHFKIIKTVAFEMSDQIFYRTFWCRGNGEVLSSNLGQTTDVSHGIHQFLKTNVGM